MIFKIGVWRMSTYLAKVLAYNALGVKTIRPKLSWLETDSNAFYYDVIGKNFIFHSSQFFKISLLHQFPTFYANILQSWKRDFSNIYYTPSCVGSQVLWFNNYITIDSNQLLTSEREFNDWNHIKREFQLTDYL